MAPTSLMAAPKLEEARGRKRRFSIIQGAARGTQPAWGAAGLKPRSLGLLPTVAAGACPLREVPIGPGKSWAASPFCSQLLPHGSGVRAQRPARTAQHSAPRLHSPPAHPPREPGRESGSGQPQGGLGKPEGPSPGTQNPGPSIWQWPRASLAAKHRSV